MPYDPSKHHRRSIRLRGYDYSQAGAYFVTICALNRECLFGEVIDGELHLNPFGMIVQRWWNELPNYDEPVRLGEFVVMPNHLHGIIVITDAAAASRSFDGGGDISKKRTLGQLIGYLKFQITKEINSLRHTEFAKVLQRDYYEHIIRSEREWNAIAEYIRQNPRKWQNDRDNPANQARQPFPRTTDEYWRDVGL